MKLQNTGAFGSLMFLYQRKAVAITFTPPVRENILKSMHFVSVGKLAFHGRMSKCHIALLGIWRFAKINYDFTEEDKTVQCESGDVEMSVCERTCAMEKSANT